MMKVSEIFASIEGEGIRVGLPCVFIRFYGCNLHCSYCDSKYACTGCEYSEMSIKDIVEKVKLFHIPRATITGGEPLIQKDVWKLIQKLSDAGISVNIETNGSIDISPKEFNDIDDYIITMDWKSISSGQYDQMMESNLLKLTNKDVLKFVVGDEEDLSQMKHLIETHKDLSCHIFVSPIFNKIDPKKIVEYILNNNLSQVHVQLQIHKFIWNPNMRGV